MLKIGSHNSSGDGTRTRRRFRREINEEAVQMVRDGHSAGSMAEHLGLSGPSLLSAWAWQLIDRAGKTAATLESRVRELERELQRIERERDSFFVDRLTSFDRADQGRLKGATVVSPDLSVPAGTRAMDVDWSSHRCGRQATPSGSSCSFGKTEKIVLLFIQSPPD